MKNMKKQHPQRTHRQNLSVTDSMGVFISLFIALLSALLSPLPVFAIGIGTLDNQVPVSPDTSTELTFYLTNTKDQPVIVDLRVEGDMAKYVTLSKSKIELHRKNEILPVQATVYFKKETPTKGSALIVATEKGQSSHGQIGVTLSAAAPIRFNFYPELLKKQEQIPVLQAPLPPNPQQPNIKIREYLATSTARKTAFSTGILLFIVAALLSALDIQIFFRRRRQSKKFSPQVIHPYSYSTNSSDTKNNSPDTKNNR